MTADKAPYKLTIKLKSARPDAISEALQQLRELAGQHDQTGEVAATVALEGFKELPLTEIRDQIELWLHRHRIGIECEITMRSPGVRPETAAVLRAAAETPMDRAGWEVDSGLDEQGSDDEEDEPGGPIDDFLRGL